MLFENGILNLTNWLGNVILPTLSGLFFAIAIVRFVGPGAAPELDVCGLPLSDDFGNTPRLGSLLVAAGVG